MLICLLQERLVNEISRPWYGVEYRCGETVTKAESNVNPCQFL